MHCHFVRKYINLLLLHNGKYETVINFTKNPLIEVQILMKFLQGAEVRARTANEMTNPDEEDAQGGTCRGSQAPEAYVTLKFKHPDMNWNKYQNKKPSNTFLLEKSYENDITKVNI